MEQDDRAEVVETKRSSTELRDVDTTPPTREVSEVDAAPRRNYMQPRSDTDRVESAAYDPYEARRMLGYRVTQLVYWVFGLIEGLIAIRFVLKALGANTAAGFAQFIYGVTNGLVSPFMNLFANPTYQGTTFGPQRVGFRGRFGYPSGTTWLISVWLRARRHRPDRAGATRKPKSRCR